MRVSQVRTVLLGPGAGRYVMRAWSRMCCLGEGRIGGSGRQERRRKARGRWSLPCPRPFPLPSLPLFLPPSFPPSLLLPLPQENPKARRRRLRESNRRAKEQELKKKGKNGAKESRGPSSPHNEAGKEKAALQREAGPASATNEEEALRQAKIYRKVRTIKDGRCFPLRLGVSGGRGGGKWEEETFSVSGDRGRAREDTW
jgi:hypothetical protein